MIDLHPVIWFILLFVFLLGVAIGHSIIQLRIRREENRKKELDLALLERKAGVLPQESQTAEELEEVLYKARVRREIDDIISRS